MGTAGLDTTYGWGARLLLVSVVVGAAACGEPANCFEARKRDAISCDTIDADTLVFEASNPRTDIADYCQSECLDFGGVVVIGGYETLSDVPLLAKLRSAFALVIQVDTLTDLTGLEAVESVSLLSLRGSARITEEEPAARFSSLRGFGPKTLDQLVMSDMYGALTGSQLERVNSIGFRNVAMTEADFSELNPTSVTVNSFSEVGTIRFGASPMTEVLIENNPALLALEWDPLLRVSKSVRIVGNGSLSNCRAVEFGAQTNGGRDAGLDKIADNGPCP
ncbi:MAG: hypothetical protein ACO1OB_30305 [Archangium sp.]